MTDAEHPTQDPPKSLAREAIYELVWSKPIAQIARTYGMSGARFTTLCRLNGIPTPPPGYWMKRRNGKHVARRALPKAREGQQAVIEIITPKPSPARTPEPRPTRTFDPDVAAALVQAEAVGTIHVSSDAESVSKQVQSLRREWIRRRKEDRYAHVPGPKSNPTAVDVSEVRLEQALAVLDALCAAFLKLHHSVKVEAQPQPVVLITILGERLGLRIRERLTSRPFDPKRDARAIRFEWERPKRVWEYTGRLELELRSPERYGAQRVWGEDEPGLLNKRLDRVVREAIQLVQTQRENRARQRQMEQERRDAEVRQFKEEQARRVEGKRVDALLAMASRMDQAGQVRRFVAACRAELATGADVSAAPAIEAWLEWASAVAARIDPLTGGVGRAREVAWNVSPY